MSRPLPEHDPASLDDYAQCKAAIRQGSRSFYAASLTLPPSVRTTAYALYAFCRLSDDAIDEASGAAAALDRLKLRLERLYAGRPLPFAADRAMADLVRRHDIPRDIPEALLEGFSWDVAGRRYESLEDLLGYAARVAGTVGVMMSLIMGVRSPEALARACDLGCAMQLTNIARDVGEDARAGRLYLPLRWLRAAGIDPDAFLQNPEATAALKSVVARLLAEADQLYRRARSGVALLPFACRPAILAAAFIYADIGRALEDLSLDSVQYRARVATPRKLRLMAGALTAAPLLRAASPMPALQATRFLIEAVELPLGTDAFKRRMIPPKVDLVTRFVRVLDIFERLERAAEAGD